MSSLHTSGGLKSETPSTSETAVGGDNSLVPKDSQPAASVKDQSANGQSSSISSSKPGSAEAAAEVCLPIIVVNEQRLILIRSCMRSGWKMSTPSVRAEPEDESNMIALGSRFDDR